MSGRRIYGASDSNSSSVSEIDGLDDSGDESLLEAVSQNIKSGKSEKSDGGGASYGKSSTISGSYRLSRELGAKPKSRSRGDMVNSSKKSGWHKSKKRAGGGSDISLCEVLSVMSVVMSISTVLIYDLLTLGSKAFGKITGLPRRHLASIVPAV